MKFSVAFVPLLSALLALGSPVATSPETHTLEKRGISQSVYDNLVWYFKFASSSYWSGSCANPNGKTVVLRIDQSSTDTQGFIVRDDAKKEIVVALRGSSSVFDFLITDAYLILKDFTSPGVTAPSGTKTHSGFTNAWNSIASSVISTVRSQLTTYPGYTIVTSGHSLGGALATLAGVTLKGNFPSVPIRIYTYGQPRTGNPTFASWVNSQIGVSNIFRVVHTTDGVPAIIPQILGYKHTATEYWQAPDPASPSTTFQCDTSGEDGNCSNGFPIKGIIGHTNYFNYIAITPFCS